MSQRGGMSPDCANTADNSTPNFCTSTGGIKKRDMLRPRNSRDHSEPIAGRPVEKPPRRRCKGTEGIDTQLRHQGKVKLHSRNFGKGHALLRKCERSVGHAL